MGAAAPPTHAAAAWRVIDYLNEYYDRARSIVEGGLLGQFAPPEEPVKLVDDGFGNLLDGPTAKLISDIAHGTPDQAAALHRRVQDRFGADPRSAYFFHAAINDMDAGYTPEEQQKYLGPIGGYRFRNDPVIFNAMVGGALAGSVMPRATPAPGAVYQLPARSYTRNPMTSDESSGIANEGFVDPNRIRTIQSSISSSFQPGRSAGVGQPVSETVLDLRRGLAQPKDIETIRIFNRDGKVYTLDHRRLVAAREAGMPVRYRKASSREVAKDWPNKHSTENDGMWIDVKPTRGPRER